MKKITLLLFTVGLCSNMVAQQLLKDIILGSNSSYPNSFTLMDGTLYFMAQDASLEFGRNELWKTDGTAAGTVMVKDINPTNGSINGNNPNFVVMGGNLYFAADNGTQGSELWKSDGTETGTSIVKDINTISPFGAVPRNLCVIGNTLYFSANDGSHGVELWKSDGTAGGTMIVKDIFTGSLNGIQGSDPIENFAVVANTLYFAAADGTSGRELWKSDGTEAGTVMVKNLNTLNNNGVSPKYLKAYNGNLYFTGTDNIIGEELYKSDGTESGTALLKDIAPGYANSAPRNQTVFNNIMYFRAINSVNGNELWRTDGSELGTYMVKDINPTGDMSYDPYFNFCELNGLLYFNAVTVANGCELWSTNGTEAGTMLAVDLVPGANSSTPSGITNINSTLYFSAYDGPTGTEVYKSNGTPASTQMLMDISTGISSGAFGLCHGYNGSVYFPAFTPAKGTELWKYSPALGVLEMNVNNNSITTYPNPCYDNLAIEINNINETLGSYIISDLTGKIVLRGKLSGKISTIDVSTLETGLYLLNAENYIVKIMKH